MPSVQAIIDRQLRRWEIERSLRAAQPSGEAAGAPLHPVVTISRERGSGGSRVAELVAGRLDYTLLHRDVIDRICHSTGTRRHILEALDEHARSEFAIWWEGMIAQRYTDASDYVKLLLETIHSLAALGGVVVVGRGSNFIVGPERGLHVRIVAPREQRLERLVRDEGFSRRDAAHEIDARDHERVAFIRKVHGRDIADPAGYDLTINTGALAFETVADLIVRATREKFARPSPALARPPAVHH